MRISGSDSGVVRYCVMMLTLIFTSCSCIEETRSLAIADQPGEILDCLIINGNGDFESEDNFPPGSCVKINGLEDRIRHLSAQYKISPGGWGPVCLVVQIENIPPDLTGILSKWDELCRRCSVPYILELWDQTAGGRLQKIEIKSEKLTAPKKCVKEIAILPGKILLRSPYRDDLHWDTYCTTSQELLRETGASIYMDKYVYDITMTDPNEQMQWRILFDIAKFMNEHHLRYRFSFKNRTKKDNGTEYRRGDAAAGGRRRLPEALP